MIMGKFICNSNVLIKSFITEGTVSFSEKNLSQIVDSSIFFEKKKKKLEINTTQQNQKKSIEPKPSTTLYSQF